MVRESLVFPGPVSGLTAVLVSGPPVMIRMGLAVALVAGQILMAGPAVAAASMGGKGEIIIADPQLSRSLSRLARPPIVRRRLPPSRRMDLHSWFYSEVLTRRVQAYLMFQRQQR